jgi:Uma2 family endonuclease
METYTDFSSLDLTKSYTYADYLLFKFKERLEIIRGKVYAMSPAPNVAHQKAATTLTGIFYNYFHKTPCQVFSAPFDVRLSSKNSESDETVATVVQPDLCVFCDEAKLDERGGIAAPDLIIEILSPGNTHKEMRIKYDLYESHGVREYWLVHPLDKTILIYSLENGQFVARRPYIEEDTALSIIFPELRVPVAELF